jgi:hypothetical protein
MNLLEDLIALLEPVQNGHLDKREFDSGHLIPTNALISISVPGREGSTLHASED